MSSAERLTPASVASVQPAAKALALRSNIDLNSPAIGGVGEPAGSVSEPVTIEFTIRDEQE
ncbi:MAG: hypothetical protein JXA69_10855 [Phycisphaerae bacterium]|nr:hypothetical protein [Phycisphaerae bacterium]